jgi:hypothetical protein
MGRTKTTNNRGTPLINIPIQFHIGSVKLYWQTVQDKGMTLFVGNWFSGVTLENIDLGDGWELVRRYLSVKPTDKESVLEFLKECGEFKAPEGSIKSPTVETVPRRIWDLPVMDRHGKPVPKPQVRISESFSPQEFAMIQDYVRRMVITRNLTLPTPWPGRQAWPYEIAFGRSRSGSRAHVLVTGTYRSILATVQFKLAQGAKFRICSRKDCRLPFEITSRHTRRFCTQYCAHITSLRQRRKVERTSKRKRELK